MAKGDLTVFDAHWAHIEAGVFDFAADQFAMAFLSDPITSLLKSETNPALGSANCNEVSAGGNYPAGGINLTLDNSNSGGTRTIKLNTGTHAGGVVSVAADPSGPTNVKTALIYDKDATSPADAAIAFIDLTEDDGVTAKDNSAVAIEVTFGQGGNPGEIYVGTITAGT